MIPRLAITPGEPAGIGPDVVLTAAQQPRTAQWVVVADPELMRARAAQLNLSLHLSEFDPAAPAKAATTHPATVGIQPMPGSRVIGSSPQASRPFPRSP